MPSPNGALAAELPSRRRYTVPCLAGSHQAHRVSMVPHIHDLTGRPAARGRAGAVQPPAAASRASIQHSSRLRRLSDAPRRHSTQPFPSWEHSLRTSAGLPPISRSRSRTRRPAKDSHTKSPTHCDEADRDSLGPSLTDSDESARATDASAPESRKPSADFLIQYNRVSLRGQEEAAAARVAAQREAACATLGTLFVPLWRLHRYKSEQRHAEAVSLERMDHEARRLTAQRREAVDLITHVLQSRLPTVLPYAVAQLRAAAVRIQRCYRAHNRVVEAVVELNYRQVRQREERQYWERIVLEREDALQKQADARAAALVPVETSKNDVSLWRGAPGGGAKRRLLPSQPVELDVYNYFLVGPLPERLLRRELRKAVVSSLHARLRHSQQPNWMTSRMLNTLVIPITQVTPGTHRASADIRVKQRRLLPTFLPHETLVAVLDNVCFLASQFRNDAMLRSHLRGRPQRILSYD